ncbi:hypothetical protein FOCC_FOCC008965 [Frankliniella occidentalis]|nr:hypothetical protein FOCC_FOCC008965 [Frankliniella occidentalis]
MWNTSNCLRLPSSRYSPVGTDLRMNGRRKDEQKDASKNKLEQLSLLRVSTFSVEKRRVEAQKLIWNGLQLALHTLRSYDQLWGCLALSTDFARRRTGARA